MNVEDVKITDIIKAEYNPRVISEDEYSKLANSIREFGLVDPIIINLKNMKIIGGHQRYDILLQEYTEDNGKFETLKLLRLGDIGWVLPEMDLKIKDEDHEKALNLALNKITGEFDYAKLEPLLNELELTGLDIELTGFSKSDLELSNIGEYDFEDDEFDTNVPDDMVDVTGEAINKGYGVYFEFQTVEKAEAFLDSIGLSRELKNNSTVIYDHEIKL